MKEEDGARQPTESLVGEIERFLVEIVSGLPTDEKEGAGQGRGRPRILPALCLWSGLLVCVLRGFSSQLALWRLLAVEGFWQYPRLRITDQAVYKRLSEAGSAPMQWLFVSVTTVLAERLKPWVDSTLAPFASEVLSIDGTKLDPLARRLTDPADGSVPKPTLPGKLVGLFDLRRQQWRRMFYRESADENDKFVARDLLEGLSPGALILADLGFFAFEWFDDLTRAGHWWISRLRNKTSLEVIHTNYQDGDTLDQLVWLGAYRADQAQFAVRLIQFRHGDAIRSYLTNVLDPRVLSLHDVAALYARRWDIEMAIQLVKQHLGLRLWWSTNLVVVQHQIWATLIIAQILMAMRVEIAGRANVDLFDVSLPLLAQYLPRLAARGEDPVAVFVRDGHFAGFIRPSRRIAIRTPQIDPSLFKPPPPNLPLLRTPRYAHRRSLDRQASN